MKNNRTSALLLLLVFLLVVAVVIIFLTGLDRTPVQNRPIQNVTVSGNPPILPETPAPSPTCPHADNFLQLLYARSRTDSSADCDSCSARRYADACRHAHSGAAHRGGHASGRRADSSCARGCRK